MNPVPLDPAQATRDQLRAILGDVQGANMTARKAAELTSPPMVRVSGFVLMEEATGIRTIVELGAVRHLSNAQAWSLMHPERPESTNPATVIDAHTVRLLEGNKPRPQATPIPACISTTALLDELAARFTAAQSQAAVKARAASNILDLRRDADRLGISTTQEVRGRWVVQDALALTWANHDIGQDEYNQFHAFHWPEKERTTTPSAPPA